VRRAKPFWGCYDRAAQEEPKDRQALHYSKGNERGLEDSERVIVLRGRGPTPLPSGIIKYTIRFKYIYHLV